MCTGFIRKGKDLIAGYNLDLAVGAWDYRVCARADAFYIGIKIGSTVYRTHGVHQNGSFGNLAYMNDPSRGVYRRGRQVQRLDLLINGYLAGKRSYGDVLETVAEKEIVNAPNASMHSLLADRAGHILLIEPGLGYREIAENFAVISNFPLLEEPADLSPAWYGKDRYDRATALLENSGDGFSAMDGLELLKAVKQEGAWATRVSFVYSRAESAVYYVQNNDFSAVRRHAFGQ